MKATIVVALASSGIMLACGCSSSGIHRSKGAVTLAYQTRPAAGNPFAIPGKPVNAAVGEIIVQWSQPAVVSAGQMNALNLTFSNLYGLRDSETLPALTTRSTAAAQSWTNYVTSQVKSKLSQRAQQAGINVNWVSRDARDVSNVHRERDLEIANLKQQNPNPAPMMGVDLYIQGEITGTTHIRSEMKAPMANRVLSVPVGVVPWVGGLAAGELRRPKQQVERTITVGGNLRAVDATTNRVWYQDSIQEQTTAAKKSHWSDGSEMDLPSVDAEIKQILDREIDQFVDGFFPGSKTATVMVRSSSDHNSKLGVQTLLENNPQEALVHLNAAIAEDPEDHKSLHAAAVASEQIGDLQTACDYYARAAEIAREGGKKEGREEVRRYRADLSRADHRRSLSGASLAGSVRPMR